MNKHKPDCLMMQPIPFPLTDGYPQKYCTCGLDQIPPPPCPHCKGTGRQMTPEPPEYKSVEPYVGDGTGRPYFKGGD